jgi:hypothetical protein
MKRSIADSEARKRRNPQTQKQLAAQRRRLSDLRARVDVRQLQLAVALSRVDLDAVSDSDLWQTVELPFQKLLHRGQPGREVRPGEFDRRMLAVLQEKTRALLTAIAAPFERSITIAGDLRLSFLAIREADGVVRTTLLGPVPDRLQYQLIRLLEDVGAERLLVCQAERPHPQTGICGRLFVKVTQKKFCSTRCQSRHYMRMEREAGKQLPEK